jgi:hypothetical protein
MQKNLVRKLKNHYGYRWQILRHNQKNTDKIGSVHDAVLTKYLVPGTTLAIDYIGYQYQDIVPNLSVDRPGVYDNLLMLNSMTLKYRSLDEIADQIQKLSHQCRHRMIVGFNFQFLQFNRLKYNFNQVIELWINQLEKRNILLVKNLTAGVPKSGPYGDCIFVFDIKDTK